VEDPEIIADAGQNNCCSNGVLNLNATFNCLYQMVLNKYLNNNIQDVYKICVKVEL